MKKKATARLKARRQEILDFAERVRTEYQAGDLEPKRAGGGVGYVIHERGEGRQLMPGQAVAVMYAGMLSANGELFDDNFHNGKAFNFHVGNGEVIGGWDVGVALLNRGAKASLFIPPSMGYGRDGYPPEIPGGAELYFYVEVL